MHIIQYPSGLFGFVGNVPQCLAHEGSPEDLAIARHSGPGFAHKIAEREGRVFKTRKAASDAGFVVSN